MSGEKIYDLKHTGGDYGFCQVHFTHEYKDGEGNPVSRTYVWIPEGLHTATPDWLEPCSQISSEVMKRVRMQRLPEEDCMAKEVNAWIEANALDFCPEGAFK